MQICQTVPRQAVDLHKGSANRRAPEAGLTLVEVLIVLSIIGIATGAAMLRLGIGQQDDRLAASAQTLALEVTLAADAALSSGQDRVLEIGTEEYKLRLDPEPASAPTLWHVLSGIAVTPDAGAGDRKSVV